MLRFLSVFLGGWTISAAAAVTVLDVEDAFDLIASLNEKSLLRGMSDSDNRDPRFTMLETIREFGLQLLEEQQEITQVRTAHAAHFLELAERAGPELDKANQRVWLDRLDSEHDNIRLALDWYEQTGDADCGIRMASSMFRFWDTRDYLAEGRNRLERILGLPVEITNIPAKARALEALAELSMWQGDCGTSARRYTEALQLFESLADTLGEVRCLKGLALTAVTVRDLDQADLLAGDIKIRAHQSDDPTAIADSDWVTGILHVVRGNSTEAEYFMQRSFDFREQAGDRSDAMAAMFHLAEIATLRGDIRTACDRWLDGLERNYEVGEVWNFAWYLEGISLLLVMSNQTESACLLLGAATEWREANSSPTMRLGGTESKPNEIALDRLGTEKYAALLEDGRNLTLASAIELSLKLASDLQSLDHAGAARSDVLTQLGLTTRECDVFLMLCERLTDKEIGAALFISPRTVSTHVNAILGKLGLSSRRDVPAKAAHLGVITGHPVG